MRKIFVWGRGGAGYLQMGRLRIRKKKEKWGRRVSAGWPYIHFFRRTHWRLYSIGEYVGDSVANCDGESTRHRTDLLFQIPRWFRRYFLTVHLSRHPYGSGIQIRLWFHRYCWRWTGHVTRIGPSVWIRRWFYWKNHPPKPPPQVPALFSLILNFPSVIWLVITDGI